MSFFLIEVQNLPWKVWKNPLQRKQLGVQADDDYGLPDIPKLSNSPVGHLSAQTRYLQPAQRIPVTVVADLADPIDRLQVHASPSCGAQFLGGTDMLCGRRFR